MTGAPRGSEHADVLSKLFVGTARLLVRRAY